MGGASCGGPVDFQPIPLGGLVSFRTCYSSIRGEEMKNKGGKKRRLRKRFSPLKTGPQQIETHKERAKDTGAETRLFPSYSGTIP